MKHILIILVLTVVAFTTSFSQKENTSVNKNMFNENKGKERFNKIDSVCKLTPDQKTKIIAIFTDAKKKNMETVKKVGKDAAKKTIQENVKVRDAEILKVLNKEQIKKLKDFDEKNNKGKDKISK